MEAKEMNIFEKMLNITNEIANVNKNLTVGEGKKFIQSSRRSGYIKSS